MPAKLSTCLKYVVRTGLGARLTAFGFAETKHKAHFLQFVSDCGDHLAMLDVQRDKWWTNDEGKFTVNLHVSWPAIEEQLGRHVAAGIPEFGTLSVRLGWLAAGEDHWWTIHPSVDKSRLARELEQTWTQFGQPWFDACSTLRGLCDWMAADRPGGWVRIAGLILLGDEKQANNLVREYLLQRPPREDPMLLWAIEQRLFPAKHREKLMWALMQDKPTMIATINSCYGD